MKRQLAMLKMPSLRSSLHLPLSLSYPHLQHLQFQHLHPHLLHHFHFHLHSAVYAQYHPHPQQQPQEQQEQQEQADQWNGQAIWICFWYHSQPKEHVQPLHRSLWENGKRNMENGT